MRKIADYTIGLAIVLFHLAMIAWNERRALAQRSAST
jgi:hypothetical protein